MECLSLSLEVYEDSQNAEWIDICSSYYGIYTDRHPHTGTSTDAHSTQQYTCFLLKNQTLQLLDMNVALQCNYTG